MCLRLKDVDLDIEKLIRENSQMDSMHKFRENNLFLSDKQIEILEKYGIHYQDYVSTSSLVYAIETRLSMEEIEELEVIASELSEYQYYHEVNK